jgi:hypothetical protein
MILTELSGSLAFAEFAIFPFNLRLIIERLMETH